MNNYQAYNSATKSITAARTGLVLDQPFFGALSLRLKIIEDATCKTAWTDGTSLGYNPEFIAGLTHAETIGLVAHEVLHCACAHPYRRDARDAKRWNIACDYAINSILQDSGFELPDGALLDSEFNGKSAEWIFDRLPDDDDDDQPGEVRDGDDDDQTSEDWVQATKQAAAVAAGTMGGDLKRFADQATKPPIDWRSVLRRFMQETARADYTWARPNTRYCASGLYLPSLRSEQIGRVVLAIDTSASIDQVALSQFETEMQAILAEMQPEQTDVIYCDTKVQRTETFTAGETVILSAIGGGGTRFQPVFDAVEEPPACLIYFTDLEAAMPTEPGYPVLWAVCGSKVAEFGETITLE